VTSTTPQVAIDHEELGHFSDTPLLVLACLESGPKHGHSMLRQIETAYRTRLGPGGLYGAISRLEAKGLIYPLPMEERRRPYQITEAGLRLLRAQLDTMTRLTNRGSALAESESPLPIPSFYMAESDEDVFSEMEQRSADKPTPFNKDQLPFLQLGGRGFEILSFLLKQADEPKGSVLTLVKTSRDAGRDVLVHVDGRLRVVIQCKNLENRFPLPSLLEELVKFVLYDYTERYIPEDGITYEFWAPGGLTEPAERWLAEFPHSLAEEQLREAFDHVVLANKTLGSLEWTEVGAYLRQTLTQRIRLNRHESISLTRKVKSAPGGLYEDFFQVTVVAPLSKITDVIGSQLQARNDQLLSGFTDVFRGTQIDERINEARDLVNKRDFRDAAIVLRQEESKNGHLFNDRQRFRLASNYGAIAFGENRMDDAARHFLEAVRYAPEDRLARTNEVFAYFLLGDRDRAFELGTQRRLEDPASARLAGIWINSAPVSQSPDELASQLDSALLGDAEVCISLARRCMMADQLDKADEYCARAIRANPKWSQSWLVRAQVGAGMLLEENFGARTLSSPRKTVLSKAMDDATKAVEVCTSEKEGIWPKAEAFAARAQLRFINEEVELGIQDADAAYKLTPDVLHVILLRAQAHLMANEVDSAIKLLAQGYAQEARPDVVLLYAKTLGSRAKDGDLARAAEVSAAIDVSAIPARMRDSFVIHAMQFTVQLEDWEAAAKYLDRQRDAIHPVTASAVELLIHLGRKDRDAANRSADDALASLSDLVQAGTKEFLAGLLMQLKRATDALPIFQALFDSNIPTFDARQLIACADELRLHRKVLEVCEELNRRRPADWQMLEFEVQHLEQYDRSKAIERLEEFLKRKPGHKLAQLRLSITALLHGKGDLVRSAVSDLPAVEELPVNYIMAALGLLREGPNYQAAIDYAYRYLRCHFDRQDAHEAFIQVVIMRPHQPDETAELEVVSSESAVYCQEMGSGEFRWFVLENTDKPARDFEEISLDDPRAESLIGKRVGDTFVLAAAPMGNREAIIRKIQTKYVRRFQDCMTELQVRFGPKTMLQSVYIGPPDAIEQPAMVTVMTDLQKRAKRLENIQELYVSAPISLHMYGASFGHTAYEAIMHVAQTPGLAVKCFEGNLGEPDASLFLLRERPLVLMDLTAIATIRILRLEWLFTTKLFRFAVTQGTWEALHDTLLDDHNRSGKRASARYENSQYIWQEQDAEAVEQERLENEAFLESFKQNVQVVPAIELAAVPPDERDQMKDCFGGYGAETMAVSTQEQTVLWCDDSTLGILATSRFGARRTWTQIVLLSFVEAGVLSRDDYNKAVARLIGCNYKLTFFDPACMLEACRLSDFGVARFPLRQMIETFREIAMPNGMLTRLFLEFFVALQREPLLFQKKSLIVRAMLDALWANPASHDLVLALRPMSRRLFGLNVVAEGEFNAMFDEWLRSLNRDAV
jgi:DNA-binding PadR family transcriptional regulator/tetratricopeptide (TPR) repeat protein